MEQGLFLDRVHILRNELFVDQCDQRAVPVLPDLADAVPTRLDVAAVCTQMTLYAAFCQAFPQLGFLHRRAFFYACAPAHARGPACAGADHLPTASLRSGFAVLHDAAC